MLDFHITLQAFPAEIAAEQEIILDGQSFLALKPARAGTPMAISFEQAAEALERLPRMYFEPDGSFVWVSSHDEPASWQIDGQMFDRDGRVLLVDLKGTCPEEWFNRLLACFGWPENRLAFELVRQAVLLDEVEFRKWMAH